MARREPQRPPPSDKQLLCLQTTAAALGFAFRLTQPMRDDRIPAQAGIQKQKISNRHSCLSFKTNKEGVCIPSLVATVETRPSPGFQPSRQTEGWVFKPELVLRWNRIAQLNLHHSCWPAPCRAIAWMPLL